MCDQEEPLTPKQQKLVEENHNLIYGFANSNSIDIEEYYGVLAIGLCKAARSFDNKKDKFSTYAYACMKNEWFGDLRTQHKVSNIPPDLILSYDELDADGEALYDFVDCQSNDFVAGGIMLEALIKSLNDYERKILYCLMNGMTREEVANEICCTGQNVGYHVKEIRKKAEYFIVN